MTSDSNPTSGWMRYVLIALRVAFGLIFLAAGVSKLAGVEMMVKEFSLFAQYGIGQWFRYLTGGLEIIGALLLVRPRTVTPGAALLACISIGATIAQVVVIHQDPIHAIVFAVLLGWLAYAYRAAARGAIVSAIDYPAPSLFIAGVWRGASDGATIPVVDPATGETIADLPVATRADLDEALAAADAGFKAWRAVSAFDRCKVLRAAAQLLRERAPQIGAITTTEQGKPIAESTAEAFACADIFDWYAEEARRAYGRIIPSKHPGVRHLVTKEPIGPVAAFSPWNFPTTIPSRKLAAALAAGCSVVIKPAEETPGSALALARALDDAGLPKGVLNMVFGVPADISPHLIASPVIRKVSFTGSTAIGKQLAVLAAQGMKPTTMELGGHSPVIVFADADLDRAVATLAMSKFRNAGQVCVSPTRFYVHDSIHDAFVEKFAAAAGQLRLGSGLDRATTMGPLANPRRVSAMHDMIGDAAAKGARIAAGGEAVGGTGNFWQPTLLAEVPDAARIMNEEPFGPVAVTQRFDDFDAVVAQANRLPYGLAAYAWTQSARTMADIGDALEVGMVGINFTGLTGPETPFGGVKESGHGSEGGSEGLEAFLIHKYIAQG